jgi:hypothetical protein
MVDDLGFVLSPATALALARPYAGKRAPAGGWYPPCHIVYQSVVRQDEATLRDQRSGGFLSRVILKSRLKKHGMASKLLDWRTFRTHHTEGQQGQSKPRHQGAEARAARKPFPSTFDIHDFANRTSPFSSYDRSERSD